MGNLEGSYKCEKCGAKFEYLADKVNHIKEKHEGTKSK